MSNSSLFNPHLAKSQAPPLDSVKRELARRNLHDFVQYMWGKAEPSKFVDNWHLRMICDHLQAVMTGDIKRLVINIPPRCSKSLICSVLFPSWAWIQDPSTRFLFSSYSSKLSIRDAIKSRRLIHSNDYLDMMRGWHSDWRMTSDVKKKERYENSYGGYRLATSTTGSLTGEGGDIIVVDDPHNVMQAESPAERATVLEWWNTAMSTRLNDPETGRLVVIMQRVHEGDVVGEILNEHKKFNNWDKLILPMEFEGTSRVVSTLGQNDPRTEDGELLWPDRFGRAYVENLKYKLGQYSSASQLQQRPTPRAGGIFRMANCPIREEIPEDRIVKSVRYWDKASTPESYGCYTAGVLMHKLDDGSLLIGDVVRGKWSWGDREYIIRKTAYSDGNRVHIFVEQEPGSGGKESAQATMRNLMGFIVKADKVSGSKEVRAEPYAVQVENSNVSLLRREWTQDFIDEHKMFPNGRYADQVDAASGAFAQLNAGSMAGGW